MQKLGAGDLRQADGGDIARVAIKALVHLLVHALRLERDLVEMAAPQHVLLAMQTFGGPGRTVLELALRLHRAGLFDEQQERRVGVGDDAEIGPEHAPDLCRLDIDMHELAALRIDVDRARVPIGPAVADAEHEVGLEESRIAIAVTGLQPDHAGHQIVVVRDDPPAHQGGDHRHAGQLGELHQEVAGVGVDDAAARDDQRSLRGVQHLDRAPRLRPRRGRLIDRQGLIGFDVEFDLRRLHVDRQIDQNRSGATGAHHMERLLEHHRHESRLAHGDGPFRHRLGDRFDIDGLKVFFVEPRPRRLSGDAKDRNRVGGGGVETGDHVRPSGAGGADADADIAGLGARIAVGHMRSALDVARQDVTNGATLAQRGVKWVDRGARHAEGDRNALPLQYEHCGVHCFHSSHLDPPMSLRFRR